VASEVRADVAQATALLVDTGAAMGVVFCFCLRTYYRNIMRKLLRSRFCVVAKTRLLRESCSWEAG
jgi:hypothetical protein